jgi:hypothetical protein
MRQPTYEHWLEKIRMFSELLALYVLVISCLANDLEFAFVFEVGVFDVVDQPAMKTIQTMAIL